MCDKDCENCTCDEDEIITLTDADDGTEHKFTIVQVLRVDDKDYAILTPVGECKDDDAAVILRIEQEGDEDVLVEIEDDEEFERVHDAWSELLDEEEEEPGDRKDRGASSGL